MGATHHALEDYGALLCLPHLRAYVPAFDSDISNLVDTLLDVSGPAYLRLGVAEEPRDAAVSAYAPWRKLQDGPGWLIVVTGPLVGSIWGAVRDLDGPRRPSLWLLSELPIREVPEEFYRDLARARRLLVVEEHVLQGGSRKIWPQCCWPRAILPSSFHHGRPRAMFRGGTARRSSTAANVDSIRFRFSSSSSRGTNEMPVVLSSPSVPLAQKIRRIQGPILVLGASGFVGANLLRALLAVRQDVYGTTSRKPAWRLENLADDKVRVSDLMIDSNLDALIDLVYPRTVWNCVAYGAYSFETDSQLIYRTNFQFATGLLRRLEDRSIACYVHAGSSSEYGDLAAGPAEMGPTAPNSDYAVSKVATANLIYFHGKRKHLPCANLRLYSVYGPLEDSSRLIPSLIRAGLRAIPGVRQSGGVQGLCLRRRRGRGLRRYESQSDVRRLWRVIQYRHRPQDHDRRGGQGGPRAV